MGCAAPYEQYKRLSFRYECHNHQSSSFGGNPEGISTHVNVHYVGDVIFKTNNFHITIGDVDIRNCHVQESTGAPNARV